MSFRLSSLGTIIITCNDFLFELRQQGAVLVDNLKIDNLDVFLNTITSGETLAVLAAEFKLALNTYLKELVASPVRSLVDVITFNKKFSKVVSTLAYPLFT